MTPAEILPLILAAATPAPGNPPLADFIARIQNPDDTVRGPAWQGAASQGAPAVKPLVGVMRHDDFEIARSARRALWKIVHHAGRPGAASEARAVASELQGALGEEKTAAVQRELLWMLSEIGGDAALGPMAARLDDPETRADALAAIMRLPGRKPTAALRNAFGKAPEDFKYALAEGLRVRGETVKGYPCRKLAPSRATAVTYVSPKPA